MGKRSATHPCPFDACRSTAVPYRFSPLRMRCVVDEGEGRRDMLRGYMLRGVISVACSNIPRKPYRIPASLLSPSRSRP